MELGGALLWWVVIQARTSLACLWSRNQLGFYCVEWTQTFAQLKDLGDIVRKEQGTQERKKNVIGKKPSTIAPLATTKKAEEMDLAPAN
jgi:hypothetical protein